MTWLTRLLHPDTRELARHTEALFALRTVLAASQEREHTWRDLFRTMETRNAALEQEAEQLQAENDNLRIRLMTRGINPAQRERNRGVA